MRLVRILSSIAFGICLSRLYSETGKWLLVLTTGIAGLVFALAAYYEGQE